MFSVAAIRGRVARKPGQVLVVGAGQTVTLAAPGSYAYRAVVILDGGELVVADGATLIIG